MHLPPFLKSNDTVAIAATARAISKDELRPFVELCEKQELNIVYADNIGSRSHQFAGTDKERAEALQELLDNTNVKAIFCARGGYGTARIIDHLDFSIFKNKPKWIVGFSDITVLHLHINSNFEIASLHAPMPSTLSINTKECWDKTFSILKGESGISYTISAHPLNVDGKVKGMLLGGNLSVIYSLMGSSTLLDFKDKILFLEDLDEYLYHMDRMMVNLKRSNSLTGIAALVVGGMSEMNDNKIPFGASVEEIISSKIYTQTPQVYGLSSGHISNNLPLMLGVDYQLLIKNKQAILKWVAS